MIIILFIIGLILAIYLVLLLQGHLATKKSLAALKIDFELLKEREDKQHKHFEENSVRE
jgi:hypothetical protein